MTLPAAHVRLVVVIAAATSSRLSKMLGRANVRITRRTSVHLAPEAWTQDYRRLAFRCPDEPAKVYEFVRDEDGRLAGKRAVTPAARVAG